MIGHTGNINGFNTYAEYSEKTNSYVVVLVNVSQDKIDSVGLARELSAIQNRLTAPDFKLLKLSNKELRKYKGKYNRFGSEIELTVEKSSLKVTQSEQPIMVLQPMKDGRFFVDGSLTVYDFNSDETGQYLNEYYYLSSTPFRHLKID